MVPCNTKILQNHFILTWNHGFTREISNVRVNSDFLELSVPELGPRTGLYIQNGRMVRMQSPIEVGPHSSFVSIILSVKMYNKIETVYCKPLVGSICTVLTGMIVVTLTDLQKFTNWTTVACTAPQLSIDMKECNKDNVNICQAIMVGFRHSNFFPRLSLAITFTHMNEF